MLNSLRRAYHRMFPRYRTPGRNRADLTGDQAGTGAASGLKDQGFDSFVPGAAAPGYVNDYDEGRPKH